MLTASSNDKPGKTAEICNDRITPRRAMVAGGSHVMSWPSNRIGALPAVRTRLTRGPQRERFSTSFLKT